MLFSLRQEREGTAGWHRGAQAGTREPYPSAQAAEVMAYLYNNVRYPFWDEEAAAASLETLDALIREVPIYLLECRADEEAVRITRDAIFDAEA